MGVLYQGLVVCGLGGGRVGGGGGASARLETNCLVWREWGREGGGSLYSNQWHWSVTQLLVTHWSNH